MGWPIVKIPRRDYHPSMGTALLSIQRIRRNPESPDPSYEFLRMGTLPLLHVSLVWHSEVGLVDTFSYWPY